MTLRELILKSIEQLVFEGQKQFTPEDVYKRARKLDPKVKRSSILGSMTSLLVNIPNSPYPPKQRFLERICQGVYRLKKYSPKNKLRANQKRS